MSSWSVQILGHLFTPFMFSTCICLTLWDPTDSTEEHPLVFCTVQIYDSKSAGNSLSTSTLYTLTLQVVVLQNCYKLFVICCPAFKNVQLLRSTTLLSLGKW